MKGEKAEIAWDPESNNDSEYPRVNKLIVKQILLGVEAAENEYNVVEVRKIVKLTTFFFKFVINSKKSKQILRSYY